MAAVYSDVITGGGSWDCETCGLMPDEWERRGRCVRLFSDAPEQLPVVVKRKGHDVSTRKAYPAKFDQCPRSLLRRDLYPAEVSTAVLVSQAAHAEVKRRWPDVPARLWELAVLWEEVQLARIAAYEDALYAEVTA
jgi:hypothetical protein